MSDFHESWTITEREHLYPIQHPDLMVLYFKMRDVIWNERTLIDHFTMDKIDLPTLTGGEKRLFRFALTFLAVIDSIIAKALGNNYLLYFSDPEFGLVYGVQIFMEGIHHIVYNEFIKVYYNNDKTLLTAYQNDPVLQKKIAWIKTWLAHDDIRIKVFIQTLIEGVDLINIFGIVFWFKTINKLKGFTGANEYIEIDEFFHYETGCCVYNKFKNKLSYEVVKEILFSYMSLTEEFFGFIKQENLLGLNYNMIISNTKYYVNQYLSHVDYPALYTNVLKLPYLQTRDIGVRNTSFFTKATTDYKSESFTSQEAEMEF